jgi:hypothetical protein
MVISMHMLTLEYVLILPLMFLSAFVFSRMQYAPVVGFHILTCCAECGFFPRLKYQEWF